jgi:glycerophosphoryl diester phosphodiesterase
MTVGIKVIAHRGASKARPENTVAAFRFARELGADWVELDVRATKDRALAVHHDAAATQGPAIANMLREEIPASVPLLADALLACAGMGVNVEIKNLPNEPGFDEKALVADLVVEVLAGNDPAQPILVSSFHPGTLERLRALEPAIATALLTFNLPDPAAVVAACVAAGHAALNPFVGTVDRALVESCHEAGLAVNVWTVDDPERMAELVELGVDGIVTNVPDVARRVLDGLDAAR